MFFKLKIYGGGPTFFTPPSRGGQLFLRLRQGGHFEILASENKDLRPPGRKLWDFPYAYFRYFKYHETYRNESNNWKFMSFGGRDHENRKITKITSRQIRFRTLALGQKKTCVLIHFLEKHLAKKIPAPLPRGLKDTRAHDRP